MPSAAKTQKADPLLDAAIDYFAAHSHDAWRRTLLKTNPDQKGKLRMRLRGGVMVDINQPWAKLHPKAKRDNTRAARDAYDAIRKFPNDREAASDYVHKAWIRRNKADPNQSKELFKPYAALSKIEKDKDRAHVDNMKRALAAVKRVGVKAARKGAPKKSSGPAPLAIDLKTWRRLEDAAAQLAESLGHAVTADILVAATISAPPVKRTVKKRPSARAKRGR